MRSKIYRCVIFILVMTIFYILFSFFTGTELLIDAIVYSSIGFIFGVFSSGIEIEVMSKKEFNELKDKKED